LVQVGELKVEFGVDFVGVFVYGDGEMGGPGSGPQVDWGVSSTEKSKKINVDRWAKIWREFSEKPNQ